MAEQLRRQSNADLRVVPPPSRSWEDIVGDEDDTALVADALRDAATVWKRRAQDTARRLSGRPSHVRAYLAMAERAEALAARIVAELLDGEGE